MGHEAAIEAWAKGRRAAELEAAAKPPTPYALWKQAQILDTADALVAEVRRLRAERDAALALCDESAHRFAGHSADLATAVRAALGVTTGTRDRGDVVTEPEIPDAADRARAHAMRCIARMIETRAAAGLTEAHEAERAHVDRLINRLAAGVQRDR
jgi:hypothetical protein